MNSITDVASVSVAVANQDDGLAFFTAKLGFEIRRDTGIGGTFRWVTVAAPGAAVEVALQQDPERVGQETGIRFATPDAQAEHRHLAEQGVAVEELLRWPGVPPMFKFRDPDGNTFIIIETS
jgi:catechol 2,3-dioxygenase-like lactoylglutathione lyase family enzyme